MNLRHAISVPRPSLHFALAAGVYAALFLVSRAPFFVHYFTFRLDGDYNSYAWEAQRVLNGIWPEVAIRPPGYILFLAAYGAFSSSVYGLLVVQGLLTMASGTLLVYAASRWRPVLAWPCAVALVAAHFGEQSLNFDTTPQSDGLLSVALLVSIASLIIGLTADQPKWLVAASAAMGLAIWTKPAALFLLPIAALVMFDIWRRRRVTPSACRARMHHVWLPLATAMFSLLLYNAATVGHPTVSKWGEMNLAGATMILWETDPAYPATVNADIERVQRLFNQGERTIVRTSRDVEDLYRNFYRGFNVLFAAGRIFPTTVGSYDEERPWIWRVTLDSIAKNPRIYSKFVLTNLWFYFTNAKRNLRGFGSFYYGLVPERAQFILDTRRLLAAGEAFWIFNHMGEDYLKGPADPLPGFNIRVDPGGALVTPKPSRLLDVYEALLAPYERICFSSAWVAVFFGVWGAALSRMLFRGIVGDRDALLVAIAGGYVVGSAILVSLVEMAIPRYSNSTLSLFYFTIAVGVAALLRPAPRSRTAMTGDPGADRRDQALA